MIPVAGQTIEQVLGQKLTNEQQILWSNIFNRFHPTAIEPIFYQGASAGSEFLTYAATKLYVCYQFISGAAGTGPSAAPQITSICDENNASTFHLGLSSTYWDATAAAARYYSNAIEYHNFYFGRLIMSGTVISLLFNGYRLTY